MKFLLLLTLLATPVFCQSLPIERGWKRIKVFKTDRRYVEKILGGSNPRTVNSEVSYSTKDGLFHFVYAVSPCSDKGDGRFRVPKGTVLEYNIFFKNGIALSEFKWNSKLYERSPSPDQPGIYYYNNLENGIMFSTDIRDGVEKVLVVYFNRTQRDISRLTCKGLN